VRRACAILTLASAGCSVSPTPYEVIAASELAPGTANDIAGTLEILGTGDASSAPLGYHTFVAFRVRLPDDTPRRIRLYTPASCDTPHPDAKMVWNLGEIRRVGDETHFFSSGVEIGDRLVNVDVVTRAAFIGLNADAKDYYPPNLVAVVEDLVAGDDNATGPISDPPDTPPHDWLACGRFTLSK
jgi:hypothetical protein